MGCRLGWLQHHYFRLLLLLLLLPLLLIPNSVEAQVELDFTNSYELQPARLSCNAQYSDPCARTNAQWLATKTSQDLNAEIEAGTIDLQTALDVINSGSYNLENNFYPFVLRKADGVIFAHGVKPEMTGTSFAEIVMALNINFYSTEHVMEKFRKASYDGGGWVRYYWSSMGYTYIKAAYALNLTDDYFIAVGYENQNLPAQLPCSADYDNWCSINNVRSLVGKAQFLLSGAETLSQFEDGLYEISFNSEEFEMPGGFYLFLYHYSGRCVSHAMLHEFLGVNIQDIFEQLNLGSREEAWRLHQGMIDAAEGLNGGWVQYPWTMGPDQDPFTKIAFVVKIEFAGEPYYLGSGYTFQTHLHDEIEDTEEQVEEQTDDMAEELAIDDQDVHEALGHNTRNYEIIVIEDGEKKMDLPSIGYNGSLTYAPFKSLSTCTAMYNTPCSFQLSLELASHATSHAISSPLPAEEIWRGISLHPHFKVNDFYVFVYDFNSTIVAHGGNNAYVGMTMQELYDQNGIVQDAILTHRLFKKVAMDGGGWCIYDWILPGTVDTFIAKIAYIWRINIDARSYYGGIGFFHERAPIREYAEKGTLMNGDPIPCSSKFSLKCSENNAKALAGNAAAYLILGTSTARIRLTGKEKYYSKLDDVLKAITNKFPAFFFSDFYVSVFWVDGSKCDNTEDQDKPHGTLINSGCCAAHGSNPEYVGLTWQEILDIENITSVSGHIVHMNLIWQSQRSDMPYNYSYSGHVGEARTKITVSSFVDTEEGGMYVLAEYFARDMPDTCDSCPEGYECTRATQAFCEPIPPSYMNQTSVLGIVALPVATLFSFIFIYWYKRRNWRKRQVLAQKIKQMESQMKDMVEIVYDTGAQIMTAEDYRDKFGDIGVGVEEAPPAKIEITWYWEESERLLSRHHASMIMMGENFVKYEETNSAQIERAYQRWKEGKGFKEFRLDLTGKITKHDTQVSGCQYIIDFEEMTQRNVWSSYARSIRREQRTTAPIDLDLMSRLPPLPKDIDFFSKDGEDYLPTYPGQVIQVAKEHPSEQWLYGSVLYDPLLIDAQNRPHGVGENEGLNRILAMALHDRPTSGWFPAALAQAADVKVMQNLVEALGGEGVTNLKPPNRWKPHKEGLISVEKGSAEYEEVAHFFLAALYEQRDHVTVVGVERIQCMPLWQSYAVKKETMRRRDAKYPEYLVNNRSGNVERRWLFHGTTAEVIPKIVKQGFNRAFAGRNAVAFGKGVYFARDAAYSSHQAYSTPDSTGIQRMFLCRVAVGDWCKGNNGQLTPDSKPRNRLELFDSTVDDVADPTIFVVYHDAQAYPDYLVSFRRNDEETE